MLIRFYKKSAKLERTKLFFKDLKNSAPKLKNQHELNISEIQQAINHQMEIDKCSAILAKLPSDLIGLQRDILSMLKLIGFRGKTNILVEDESFGEVNFWYEGSYLYFEKLG